MKIVKYILRCLLYGWNRSLGGRMEGTWKDTIVGIVSMLVIFLFFELSYIILDKKTILGYKTKVLISIGITIALVSIIFLVLIVGEKIFGL